MHVTTTERLDLRWLTPDDDAFLLRLLNEPDWLRFIGDKDVHDLEGARRYLATGPAAQYARRGFGLNRVAGREDDVPVGICGLVRREGLDHPDLGFAFLEEHRGRGYCTEACEGVLAHAAETLGLEKVLAIATLDNHASHRVLVKLSFRREPDLRLTPEQDPLALWSRRL